MALSCLIFEWGYRGMTQEEVMKGVREGKLREAGGGSLPNAAAPSLPFHPQWRIPAQHNDR